MLKDRCVCDFISVSTDLGPYYYLATPYSHNDESVRQSRYEMACKIVGAFIKKGYPVFSPIAHTHGICIHSKLPFGFPFWRQLDETMIRLSRGVIVAMIDGWVKSDGIAHEVAYATGYGLNVSHMYINGETKDEIRFTNSEHGNIVSFSMNLIEW